MVLKEKISDVLIKERYGDSLVKSSPKELLENYPIFKDFFNNINWHRNKTLCLKFAEKREDYIKNRFRILIFSEKNSYAIDVVQTDKHENPYIGCVTDCEYRLPLETWHRGSDLADGYDGEKTIMTILLEIIEREMIGLEVKGYTKDNTLERRWEK